MITYGTHFPNFVRIQNRYVCRKLLFTALLQSNPNEMLHQHLKATKVKLKQKSTFCCKFCFHSQTFLYQLFQSFTFYTIGSSKLVTVILTLEIKSNKKSILMFIFIYLSIPSFISLKMNKCQRVYHVKKIKKEFQ